MIVTSGWTFIYDKTHHASKGKECRLDLSHVAVLKQVVGLKDVMRFETIGCEGFDEVRQVFQLHTHNQSGILKNNVRVMQFFCDELVVPVGRDQFPQQAPLQWESKRHDSESAHWHLTD